jgi:hypothetical protein
MTKINLDITCIVFEKEFVARLPVAIPKRQLAVGSTQRAVGE